MKLTYHASNQFLLSMKLTIILLTLGYTQIIARGFTQKVSYQVQNVPLQKAFAAIEHQTGYSFFYNQEDLNKSEPVTVNFKNTDLTKALDELLKDQHKESYRFSIKGRTIVVSANPVPAVKAAPQALTISPPSVEVIGKVLNEKGEPFSGVSVVVIGKTTGTQTNANGYFRINTNINDTLEFSFIGYESQRIAVKKSLEIEINLKPVVKAVEEVVVVGFGKQRKISVVGAQSTVQAAELKQPVRSLSTSLAGRLAGIIAVQRSGEPGYDDAQFYIRGISTFTNANPLVLVDGIERSLNNIEPEDIQSFSILKDASATAVYGVRGANGVVLITSKTGKVGKPQINLDYNEGVTQFTKVPQLADGITFMNMANEASTTRGGSLIYSQDRIDKTTSGADPYLYPNVNWLDEIFKKTGRNRKAILNVSGGTPNARYYVSAGYYNEQGLFKTDQLSHYNSAIGLDRYTFTSNLNVTASKTTEIELGIGGYIINGNYPGTGTSTIYGTVMALPPVTHPVRFPDGKIAAQNYGAVASPYVQLTQSGYTTEFRNEFRSNVRVKQDLSFITSGLSMQALFSFDAYNYHRIARTKYPYTYIANGRDANGQLILVRSDKNNGTDFLGYNRSNGGNRKFYSEASINYDRSFGKHRVGGLLLYNQSDFVDGFASDLISAIPFRSRGLAGRATYGYDDRYFVEANFGYNGSENFSPEKRYGFFPSAGIGWVASNERFFEPLGQVFQFFKVRATYGLAGNSQIGGRRFAYMDIVGDGTGGYTFGQNIDVAYGGRDISEYASSVTWETAKKTDIGIEFKTLHNKLNVQADWFNENRTGIFLRRASLPGFTGIANAPYGNLGVTNNKGIDASVEYNTSFGEWRVGVRGNFTYAVNKVIENDEAAKAYPWLEARGHKIGQRFGYIAIGLFADSSEILKSPVQNGNVRPGDIKFKDLNGDGKINAKDLYPIGYGPVPEIVYGGGFSLAYKGFDMSVFFQGIGNVDILLNGEGIVPFQQGGNRGNLFSNITDRWTPSNPNPNAFYPRLTFGNINDNYQTSTWWIKNGRYLRLKSLEMGYTLSKKWTNRYGVKSARFYLLGNNLLTFSEFKLWDVELGNGRGTTYPNLTTFSAGVSFKF